MADHDHLDGLLAAVANGSADAADRARVDAHLSACTACRDELAAWQVIRDAAHAGAPVAPADDVVLAGVWAALDHENVAGGDVVVPLRRPSRLRGIVRPTWSAAAALLLVALVVLSPQWRAPRLEDVLLAAAVKTTEAGSATLRITGNATVLLDQPPAGTSVTRLDLRLSGDGAVRFGEAVQTRLVLDLDTALPGVGEQRQVTERLVTGGRSYGRWPDGAWVARTDPPGPLGTALLDPAVPQRVLGSAEGPIEDLGVATVDGVEMRHLRFALAPGTVADSGGELAQRADVWIGIDDGLLHRYRIRAAGHATQPLAGQWTVTLDVTLTDLGAPVRIDTPGGGAAR